MASVAAENWEYKENQDDFESLEFSHINQGLLMSLLDETQVDDCDDERLTKVIQSLEAEISSDIIIHDSNGAWNDESSSQDWSIPHDLDQHSWMDLEFAPSSPSGDMEKCWSFENSAQGIADTTVLDQLTDDEIHFFSSVVIDQNSSFI